MKRDSKILSLALGEAGVVSGLSLRGEMDYWGNVGAVPWDPADHVELADDIERRGLAVMSVILFVSPLREELFDDPNCAKRTVHLVDSEVRQDAIWRIGRNAFSGPAMEIMLDRARGLGIEVNGALATAKEDGEKTTQVEDAIYAGVSEAELLAVFPQILRDKREEFRRKVKLKGDDFQAAWDKEQMRLLAPRTEPRYQRIHPLATPFNALSYWQQFYLVRDGEKVLFAIGAGSGSSLRYNHGRYAHTLATLADRSYSGLEGTLILHLDSDNQVRLIGDHPDFKTVDIHLSGNYKSSHEEVRRLFSGKTVSFDHDAGRLLDAPGEDAAS